MKTQGGNVARQILINRAMSVKRRTSFEECLGVKMSPAQREVFLVVDEWWKSFGYGPTVDEIMDRIGARGRGNVQRKIDRLVTLGVLKKLRHVPRSLRPSYLRIRRII